MSEPLDRSLANQWPRAIAHWKKDRAEFLPLYDFRAECFPLTDLWQFK